MPKPSLSSISHSTLGRRGPWSIHSMALGTMYCCDPDTVRGPRGLFDFCLLVVDFVSQSSFWERFIVPRPDDLLPCFLAFVKDELDQREPVHMRLFSRTGMDRAPWWVGHSASQALGHHSDET